jgi:hypothetical protein
VGATHTPEAPPGAFISRHPAVGLDEAARISSGIWPFSTLANNMTINPATAVRFFLDIAFLTC